MNESGYPPRPEWRGLWIVMALLVGLAALCLFMAWPASAHDVPGHNHEITYPGSCCNSAATSPTGDCAPIDDQYVTEGPDGYEINLPIGAHPKLIHKGYVGVVPYGSVREPLDGHYHICLSTDGGARYCFFPKPGAV